MKPNNDTLIGSVETPQLRLRSVYERINPTAYLRIDLSQERRILGFLATF